MDGHAALALKGELCPGVPFIFVTGALGEETAVETLRNGATDFVLKGSPARLASAVRRALAGTRMFPGFAWRFDKTPATIRRAAPMFAEHNGEVFSELLGISGDALSALVAEGITGDRPIYAGGPAL